MVRMTHVCNGSEQEMLPQVHYLQQPAADYVKTAVWAATELHRSGIPGDILIFLTGVCMACHLALVLKGLDMQTKLQAALWICHESRTLVPSSWAGASTLFWPSIWSLPGVRFLSWAVKSSCMCLHSGAVHKSCRYIHWWSARSSGSIISCGTGQDECEAAVASLEEEARRMRKRGSGQRLCPVALYAGLPGASQLQALEPAPRGYRKVGDLRAAPLTELYWVPH